MSVTVDLPGVYQEEKSPSVPIISEGQPCRGFLVGKFASGDADTPTLCTREDFINTFGGNVPGSAGNDVEAFFAQGNGYLYITRCVGTAASVTVKDRQTPTPADKMTLTAKVDGAWANYAAGPPALGLLATVAAGTVENTFKLTLQYHYLEGSSSAYYEEVFDSLSIDPTAARYFEDWINNHSKLVTCTDEDDTATTPPDNLPALGAASLASGADGTYSTSIGKHVDVTGRLVLFADTGDSTARAALIAAANARNLKDGSVAVLNNAQYATVSAQALVGQAISDERAVLTGSWYTALDSALNVVRAVRPAGFHAGILCARHPTLSPTNKKLTGVVDVERVLTRANLVTLQDAGIQPGFWWPDDPSRGVRVINGIVTDGTQVFVRRSKDWQASAGAASLSWAVGELQGEADPDPLRTAVRGMFVAYFEDLKNSGIIERYQVTCDASNNPPASVQLRKLKVRREVKLFQVADFIIDEIVVGPESVIAQEAS